MAGDDEREHTSETKQKVAPKDPKPAKPPAPPDSFEDEETETAKLTGVGAW